MTVQEINAALDLLRPAMEADGGGIDLISVENGIVLAKLKGVCLFCPSVKLTKSAIERTLRAKIPSLQEIRFI